jgi:putative nucleotidyltransferase with HDIG domain
LRGLYDLSPEEIDLIAYTSEEELRLSESYTYDALRDILSSGVREENIISQKQNAKIYFNRIDDISDGLKPILIRIVHNNIIVNSHIDQAATEALIDEKINEVEPVIIPAGKIIAKAADPLGQEAYAIISERNLNNLHTFEQKKPLIGMDIKLALVIGIMALVLIYHYERKNQVHKVDGKLIYLNYVVVLFMYLVSLGFGTISTYLLPIATVGMLISILEEARSGIIFSFLLTILYGIVFSLPLSFVAFIMLSAMISAILVQNVFQRGRIFLAGLSVSVIGALYIVALGLIEGFTFTVLMEYLAYTGMTGILCSVITIGSLPLWETIFKMVTPLRLLEYANPNHPLMKKLLLEAPGTYHHSILVANLSEAAAHDIGANALLARVGAYFHDIGKTDRPFLYVENQYDGQNPHDQFVPRVSAKVIKDHVEKGLELGKEYKLPKEILQFVTQHHGTTMISYFYHKAIENVEESFVDKDLYTYDGPIPSRKEIAIVMLADSVEAAVRSLKNPDKESIKELIHKIVQSKIDEHQLDDSDLTLKELDIIRQTFISSLSSAFHERIEYPDIQEDTHQLNIIK